MKSADKGVVANDKYLQLFLIVLWAFLGALVISKPLPKFILPFLTLNFALLLLLPFRRYFPFFVVMSYAYPSNRIGFFVGGWEVQFIEVFFVFIVLLIFVELLWKDTKLKITPISVLVALFVISTLGQSIRGIVLNYSLPFIRTAGRNLGMWSVFFPTVVFLQNGGNSEKIIRIMLIGWGLSTITYLMAYFGIIPIPDMYFLGRPWWPPTLNIALFFPIILLTLIPFEKTDEIKSTLTSLVLMVLSAAILIPTQSRTIYGVLIIEIFVISGILVAIHQRGHRLLYFLKLMTILITLGLAGIAVLRIIMGNDFIVLFQTLLRRFDTITNLQTDLALGARRWQVWESIRILQGNWLFGRGSGFEWSSFRGMMRVDNFYFSLLVHQGVVGLSIVLAIFGLWLHRSIWLIINRNLLESYLLRAFAIAQPAVIAAILSSGITSAGFVYATSNAVPMVIFAILTEHLYREYKLKKELQNSEISS
jgi:hypothetical protein